MADSAPPVPGATKPTLSGVALVTALVVLVAFGAFVGYLITQRAAAEVTWTRMAWLFSSVEAVAFGAAGALFGSSIQRQRAEHAETQARENADAAAKGRALAEAIKADTPAEGAGADPLESLGPAASSAVARHATIARALFP